MNLESLFCPNQACYAKGQTGKGNIRWHCRKNNRFRCTECKKTFSESTGTPFHRLQYSHELFIIVVILLAYGTPIVAIQQAYQLDKRTIRDWQERGGKHCKQIHQHLIHSQKLDLQHVQADEIKVKMAGGTIWMAMAMMVSTRLWIGGALSPKRNKALIQNLVYQVYQMALCRPLLLAVDGLSTYLGCFRRTFRAKVPRRGKLGRCKYIAWPTVSIVQVVKQRKPDFFIEHRIVQGTKEGVEQLIQMTQSQMGCINTAYIERLNGTFRQRFTPLTRRSRCIARKQATLEHGMFLVGAFYNFCDPHHSLREKIWLTEKKFKWVQLTPCMKAGITTKIWTPTELLRYKIPPSFWIPPKKRGRKSKKERAIIEKWGQL